MNKFIVILFVLMASMSSVAQTMDSELKSLVDIVKMLRSENSTSYSRAQELLKKDSKWTPMNETGTLKKQECRPTEVGKRFKLNRILSTVDNGRKYVSTHGDMLNGEDERYNYSLYERSVKAKTTVEYTIKGREGKQTFVIVPYLESGSGLCATITLGNGQKENFSTDKDGLLLYSSNMSSLKREDIIKITVTNKSASNQSFVLLNHNSRNK